MKELKETFSSYRNFLALTDRQVAEVLRSIIAARANDKKILLHAKHFPLASWKISTTVTPCLPPVSSR